MIKPGVMLMNDCGPDGQPWDWKAKLAEWKTAGLQGVERAQYEAAEVDSMIAKLHDELETCDPMKIVAQMKVIVPEFKSNNSMFSQFDK